MSDIRAREEVRVGKRDGFLADLRDEARDKGLIFEVSKRRGKGSHALVRVGDRVTTIPTERSTRRPHEKFGKV
jgi:hypothetical protein